MFLLLHFLLPHKLLEGFCVTLQTVAYALYRFLGHWTTHYFLFWNVCNYFLLLIEDGICNVNLRLVKHVLLFPSGLLHHYHHDFCSHPHTDLSFTKKL
jgi:hypothetical protein